MGSTSSPAFRSPGSIYPNGSKGLPGDGRMEPRHWRVPLEPQNPPRLLQIETMAPGREVVQLQVLANGIELWNEPISPDPWSKTFSLEQVPMNDVLRIELRSDTFSPAEKNPDSPDVTNVGCGGERDPLDDAR